MQAIPKEIHLYQSSTTPNHPDKKFTINIIKENKKAIMATVCNFSGYLSTTILPSKKAEHLLDRVIITVTPFMANTINTRVRVDQAPGWTSISRHKDKLANLGIDLELDHAKNKNSLTICDKRIRELRKALRVKTSTTGLNIRTLARS